MQTSGVVRAWVLVVSALGVGAIAGCGPQASMRSSVVRGQSPETMGRTAVARALDDVEGPARVVLVWAGGVDAPDAAVAAAAEQARSQGVPAVAAAGPLAPGRSGSRVLAVALAGRSVTVETLALPSRSTARDAAIRIANSLVRPDSKALILLSTGEASRAAALVESLGPRLGEIPVVGAVGGRVYHDGQPIERGVVAVMLSGEIAVGAASGADAHDRALRRMIDRGTVIENTICYSGRPVELEHPPESLGMLSFLAGDATSGAEAAGPSAAPGEAIAWPVVIGPGGDDAPTTRARGFSVLAIGVPTR